jgi:ABC-type Fe3+ transport system permease subunit
VPHNAPSASGEADSDYVRPRAGYLLLVVAFVALAALMIVYVSGDDDYYLDSSSRWNSREDAHLITVVAIAACALVAAVGAWCLIRTRRPRWAWWSALIASPVATLLWVAAYIANTAN